MIAYELKYPVGEFESPPSLDQSQVVDWINTIESFPEKFESESKGLSLEELSWRYRPEGWTIQQVVHHCADSHMNAFIRFKLAMTEDAPTIRPYFEDRWDNLPDTLEVPIVVSLDLLKNLHIRWVVLLKSLSDESLKRTYIHPEHGKQFPLYDVIGQYAWHCEHHFAHVKQAKTSKGSYN